MAKTIKKKERKFIKEQIPQMNISSIEKDILTMNWGTSIFKTEEEIKQILKRKEIK